MRWQFGNWNRKLHALEAFNGQYFFNLPTQKSQTGKNDARHATAHFLRLMPTDVRGSTGCTEKCANEKWKVVA